MFHGITSYGSNVSSPIYQKNRPYDILNYHNSRSSENPLGFAAWLVQEHACMIGRVVTRINFC